MTKEEIKRRLINMERRISMRTKEDKRDFEALEAVLFLLEQEPCGDAISRKAALKEGYDIVIEGERYRVIQEETLLGLPSITQKSSEDMPCITPEEMQKCKDIVKRYKPKQQTCEDAVSREVVIEWLKDKDIIKLKSQEKLARKELNELPSVTQKPKTGHWIDSSNGWMCSECNRDNTYDTNFCPNCGADMKGKNKMNWILINEKLPEPNKEYLCCDMEGHIEICYFSSEKTWHFQADTLIEENDENEIIAWMPLPAPL